MKLVNKKIIVKRKKDKQACNKMNIFHKELASRWSSFSIFEQMANIGAEVGRANNWKKKKNTQISLNAFYRALELIDFSVADIKIKIGYQKYCG